MRLLVQVTHSPPKSTAARLNKPLLVTVEGMTGQTSPTARPAVAFFVVMGVVGLILGRFLKMASTSSNAPMLAIWASMRMLRRPLNGSVTSRRNISMILRSVGTLPPPTSVTSTTPARSAFGSRFSNQYLSPPMQPALALPSPALLVALPQPLQGQDVVTANPSSSCTTPKCCNPNPAAPLFRLPSKVLCHTSRSSLDLSSTKVGAQAFDVSSTPQQPCAPEIIISLLPFPSGTPIALPRSSFLRIIHPLFCRELYKIRCRVLPRTSPWPSSFTCHISLEMEAQPLLLLPPDPK